MKNRAALIIFAGLLALISDCGQYNYQRFIEYLKAERELRSSLNNQQELDNRIAELQRKRRIDPAKETAKFKKNEKLWVNFLTDLSRAR